MNTRIFATSVLFVAFVSFSAKATNYVLNDDSTLSTMVDTANNNDEDHNSVVIVVPEKTGGASVKKSLDILGMASGTTITDSIIYTGGNTMTSSLTNIIFAGGGIKNGDGFSPEDAHNLTLNNVSILNRGSTAITNTGKLLIEGGNYSGNSSGANGGGAILNNFTGQLTIKGSGDRAVFSSNKTTDNGGAIQSTSGGTNVSNADFTDNYATYYGGAISFGGTDNVVVNSVFERNIADAGGALYSSNSSGLLEISGSTFTGNHTRSEQPYSGYGGAVSTTGNLEVTNSTFDGNYAQSGGAIEMTGKESYINYGKFINNESLGYGGGALYQGGKLVISGTLFDTNKALNSYGSGGAIYMSGNVLLTDGATFRNNVAGDSGGAIGMFNSPSLSIAGSVGREVVFEDNTTQAGSGGAISGTITTISNAKFSRNHADSEYGGAIYTASRGMIFDKVYFEGNTAFYGGAIFNMASSDKMTINGGSSFVGNKASVGGAIFLNEISLVLDTNAGNIIFSGNKASDNTVGMGGNDIFSNGDGNVITITGDASKFEFDAKDYPVLTYNEDGSLKDNNILSMDGGIAGLGKILKSGDNTLLIKKGADNSLFDGKFEQTAGITIVEDADSMFKGGTENNLVSNSSLFVTGKSFSYGVTLGDNGKLFHNDTVRDMSTITNEKLVFSGSGATATFGRDASLTDMARYNLHGSISNKNLEAGSNSNTLAFENSKIFLVYDVDNPEVSNNYEDSTLYSFKDSDISLSGRNERMRSVVFNGNFAAENTSLSFDIYADYPEGMEVFTSDQLVIKNPVGDIVLNLGDIRVLGERDHGLTGNVLDKVLEGASFRIGDMAHIATDAYFYVAEVVEKDGKGVLNFDAKGSALLRDEDTDELILDDEGNAIKIGLQHMNEQDGTRGFNFSFFNPDNTALGIYKLTESLEVMNEGTFTVQGFAEDTDYAVIDGQGKYSGFYMKSNDLVTNFTLKNLMIKDMLADRDQGTVESVGSAVMIGENSGSVNIDSVTFENNQSATDGGSIYNAGKLVVNNSVFTNREPEEGEERFMNVFDDQGGGAIYLHSYGQAVILNTKFEGLGAVYFGGAIMSHSQAEDGLVVASGSTFTNNYAGERGGAIFVSNYATEEVEGVERYKQVEAHITDSTFESNTVGDAGGGGAVYNFAGSTMNVTNSIFNKNSVGTEEMADGGMGGAIYNSIVMGDVPREDGNNLYESILNVSNSQFTDNKADYAGAILNAGSATIRNSKFSGNVAEFGHGGAIYSQGTKKSADGLEDDDIHREWGYWDKENEQYYYEDEMFTATLNISNSEFTDNTASKAGGAIYSTAGLVSLADNTFSGNIAGSNGGALYLAPDSKQVEIARSEFRGNKAQKGSGGAIYSSSGNEITISGRRRIISENLPASSYDTEFYNNTASEKGGAVYLASDSILNLNTTSGDVTFRGNKAKLGNDIYLTSSELNVLGSGGDVYIGGGIADDGASTVNMSSKGTFTFGTDSQNSDFGGTFNANSGTTNIYSNNWGTGENFINKGATVHFFKSNETGIINLAEGGILDVRYGEEPITPMPVIMALASNSGPALSSSNKFNDLTMTNFNGSGGTVMMSTDGTDADTLFITESAIGNAFLNFTTIGDSPTNEKIEVVNLNEATDKSADFKLLGASTVDVGAWAYSLEKETDENWYLEKTGELSQMAQIASGIPALHLTVVKSGLNELRKRMGDLRNNNDNEQLTGAWIRTYGKHMKVDDKANTSMNLYGVEGGIDALFDVLDGKLYAGVMAGTVESHDIDIRTSQGKAADGTAKAPSIGAYMTWIGQNNWFVDLTARHFWVHTDIEREDYSNGYDVERNFWAFSAETGKMFYMDSPEFMNIGTDSHSMLSIEPKVELRYKRGEGMNFKMDNGTRGSVDATESVATKFNLQMNYLPDGLESEWKPFIEVGVYNEWIGHTDMNFAGTDIRSSETKGLGFEVTAGVNATISDDTYVYGAITAEIGKVYTSYLLNLGIRVKF